MEGVKGSRGDVGPRHGWIMEGLGSYRVLSV